MGLQNSLKKLKKCSKNGPKHNIFFVDLFANFGPQNGPKYQPADSESASLGGAIFDLKNENGVEHSSKTASWKNTFVCLFFCSFKGKKRKWRGAFAKNSSMEKDGNLLFFGGLKVKNENGVEHSLKTAS